MPFKGEQASKHGHSDIIANPEVQSFLSNCSDIPSPKAEELEREFESSHRLNQFPSEMPDLILAMDGSSYESPVDGRYPSRMIGYIKIGTVLLDMRDYDGIKNTPTRYINPMDVARLQRETASISLALPGAYVQLPECESVTVSYRLSIQKYFRSDATSLGGNTLYDTLVFLIGKLGRLTHYDGEEAVQFDKCPSGPCLDNDPSSKIYVPIDTGVSSCPVCGSNVFVVDSLRTHEAFAEAGSNIEAYNRLMGALEHILVSHYLKYMWENNKEQLSRLCLLMDGPLAIFGQSAHFHRAIQALIDEIRVDLAECGLQEPLIMGITKTGRVCEHFQHIDHILPDSIVLPISDDYRYKFIEPSKFGSEKNFGAETYYGQDFLVKTKGKRRFALCLAYPWGNKKVNNFKIRKSQIENYKQLKRALSVLSALESDLYENSMIPVVLAHRHASISLKPGGKVLDVNSRNAFKLK